MNATGTLILTACIASVVVLVATPVVLSIARRKNLMDEPGSRKVHTAPIARVGGVAILLAVMASVLTGLAVVRAGDLPVDELLAQKLLVLLAVSACVFVVGLADDLKSLSSRFKALTLVGAALVLSASGIKIEVVLLRDEAWLEFNWLTSHVITVLWVVTVVVAINFIDGLDGLASGLVLLAALALGAVLLFGGFVLPGLVAIAMVAALAAFLVFNWRPASIFMGDGGSMFIGFLIAGLAVISNPLVGSMKAIVFPAIALGVPLLDTALTIYRRRYVQRRSVFAPERGHIHHMLLDRGLKHEHAVIAILGVSVVATLIGLAATIAASMWAAVLVGIAGLTYASFFCFAGSMHTTEMIRAFRQKRQIDNQQKIYQNRFHDLQIEFASARDFGAWWGVVCRAADLLDFALLELPLVTRDGEQRLMSWTPLQDVPPGSPRLCATVPIADRRADETLSARVEVLTGDSAESAGHRLSLFSRLISDHSVASLSYGQGNGLGQRGHHASKPRLNGSGSLGQRHTRPAGLVTRGPLKGKRVAVVHDFLYTYAGAERVLEQIVNLYPECDLFALFDFLPEGERGFIHNKPVKTSFIQHLPLARSKHRAFLPLMPLAVEQLDMSRYDVVISSSYIAAKGVITGPDQVHVCYCHSPARYAWDLQHQYLDQKHLGFGPRGLLSRAILHYIRNWDVRSASGVDVFLANSSFVDRRIQKVYRRDSVVVYPPVDTDFYSPAEHRAGNGNGNGSGNHTDFYLTASRLVPYKRVDLIVQAFERMPDRRLVVVGDGPEYERLAALAGPNVELVGYQSNERLRDYMRHAKAFLFAAEEDFGIVPVEAMACGTPVIAYGHGGIRDSVTEDVNGLFFDKQTPASLYDAIIRFENGPPMNRRLIAELARESFSTEAFRERMEAAVVQAMRSRLGATERRPPLRLPNGNGRRNGELQEHPDGTDLKSLEPVLHPGS